MSTVGAAGEHDVGAAATRRLCARDHVNVVVGRATGTVNRQKDLPTQAAGIYRAAVDQAAAHVNGCDLVKARRLGSVSRVGRSNAPKAAATIPTANVEVAVGGHVERSPLRSVRNINRSLPCGPTVGGTAKSADVASEDWGPKLVLEAVAHAGRCSIEREPFLIAAVRGAVW